MRRPLSIVHIFGNAYAGDWAFLPLKEWHQAGHKVAAICPTEGALVQRLRAEGIQVHIIPYPRRLRHIREGWQRVLQIKNVLCALKTDVVHCHLTPANLWGRTAAWLARVPVRVTQWPGPLPLELPIPLMLELATVWMDTAIIAASVATQRIFERYWHTRKKIHLIYYGFPVQPFDPGVSGEEVRREFGIGMDTPLVGMVAYMYPPLGEMKFGGIGIKGHEILLRAAPEILKTNPDVRFLIVGDELIPGTAQTYKPQLLKLARDLQLESRVIFTGRRTDIPKIIAALDCVVVPSISENVGGAVEPLLMTKPVVASRVGGLPDVVIDGETGFLVPPRDPIMLADAILRMLSLTHEQRLHMGERGRAIVINLFDIATTIRQQEDLYYQLLAK